MSNNKHKKQPIVIIMAGGLGKRMNSKLPKVLLKINEIPMLVNVIKEALQLNPYKILIVVGKYHEIIHKTIKDYLFEEELTQISFVMQSIPMGTGHAIQCCAPELTKMDDTNPVLVLSGDVPLIQAHLMKMLVSSTFLHGLCIATTIMDDPNGYGRIVENKSGIEQIIEDKDCTLEQKQIKKINGGIYCFRNDILCEYISQLSTNNAQGEFYLTDVIKLIKNGEQRTIGECLVEKSQQHQIVGVNTPEQLVELSHTTSIKRS